MKINLASRFNHFQENIAERMTNGLIKTRLPFERMVDNKPMNKTINWLAVTQVSVWFLIIGNTLKDFAGMWAYYFQSLNNPKIPENKRKYVAAYELMNGIINTGLPIILGLTLQNEKVLDDVTYHFFGKGKNGLYVDKNALEAAKKAGGELAERLIERSEKYKIVRKNVGQFSALVLVTIISKRLLAPFIAGPLASKFKSKYMSDDQPANKAIADKPVVSQVAAVRPSVALLAHQQQVFNLQRRPLAQAVLPATQNSSVTKANSPLAQVPQQRKPVQSVTTAKPGVIVQNNNDISQNPNQEKNGVSIREKKLTVSMLA